MSGTPQSGAASQGGRGPRARTPHPRYSASPAGTPSGALLLDQATSKQGSTPRAGAAKAAPAARAAKPAPAKAPAAENGAFKPVRKPGVPLQTSAQPRELAPALLVFGQHAVLLRRALVGGKHEHAERLASSRATVSGAPRSPSAREDAGPQLFRPPAPENALKGRGAARSAGGAQLTLIGVLFETRKALLRLPRKGPLNFGN